MRCKLAIIKEKKLKISSVIENLSPSGLPDAEPEKTEVSVDGFLKISEEGYEITYSEKTEGGKIVSVITVGEEGIRVKRVGAIESNMLFSEGLSHSSVYAMPPYSFDAVVTTKKIRNGLTRDGGRVDIFYDMLIGGAKKQVKMRIECL